MNRRSNKSLEQYGDAPVTPLTPLMDIQETDVNCCTKMLLVLRYQHLSVKITFLTRVIQCIIDIPYPGISVCRDLKETHRRCMEVLWPQTINEHSRLITGGVQWYQVLEGQDEV